MKITNEKGITIIALSITVVILLILSAVTIDIIIDGTVTEEAKGVVNKIEDHDNTMDGIKDDIRDLIRPEDAPPSDEEGGGNSEPTENRAPTLSISTGSIAATTAAIMASSTDTDSDTLQVTLVINGKTYTRSGIAPLVPYWSISGLSPSTKYNYTVTVTDGYETVTKTGSITTLACTHNYVGSICSVCGDKKPLADDIDYTGYYADIDGDPTTVEGVIAYVIPYNISECYEYYYISDESYTDDFGTMPVISYIDDSYTTSIYNSPFYVLALDDFSYNGDDTFYWFYDYPEINLGYNTIDYYYGFELTDYMMEEYEYREDYVERDIWSCIEEKWQEGWFVPADFEWRYFVDNLFNGSWSSYSPCGLSQCYWTSTNGEDHQGFSRRMVF